MKSIGSPYAPSCFLQALIIMAAALSGVMYSHSISGITVLFVCAHILFVTAIRLAWLVISVFLLARYGFRCVLLRRFATLFIAPFLVIFLVRGGS